MSKNRIIPFSWLPASWGLAGPAREEAEAYYTLEGYALDLRLAEIKFKGDDYKRRIAEVGREYGVLSEYEYEVEIAALIPNEVERKVQLLDIDIRYGTIDAIEGDKEIATVKGEPWIRVVNDGFDETGEYFFEFDWNDIWIEKLIERGYNGPSQEAIVDAWFDEIQRQHVSATMGAPPINGNANGIF
jgi:hypothetical protein